MSTKRKNMKGLQHSIPSVFLEGNPTPAPLQDRWDSPRTCCIRYSEPWLLPRLHLPCHGEKRRKWLKWKDLPDGIDGTLITWAQEGDQGLILYRILSVPFHATLPSHPPRPNSPAESSSHWAFTPKAFPSEEVNLSFIGFFFLRFSYNVILIYIHDLILHRTPSLVNCNILL